MQVSVTGSGQQILRMSATAKTAPRNGYVYVYVSNESNNNVYFDNLQVSQEHGPILQETHYYAFGLGIAGISSKVLKSGYAENKYKFNGGTELSNKFLQFNLSM